MCVLLSVFLFFARFIDPCRVPNLRKRLALCSKHTHIYIINNVSIRLTGPFGVESRADHRYPPPSETRGPFERGKFGLSLSSLSLSGVNQKKIGRAAAEIAWRSRKKKRRT